MNERPERGKILPELLAPAGSFDALRAAIGAGADAVYLGGRQFSARAFADNFDDARLMAALEYAHRADCRVYVTVNTLLAEEDLVAAGQFLLFLYEQGVDGVLVQDPGLIQFARRHLPGLPLHGSTQMTIHNSAGVQWAAGMGLERVVLARELDISAIRGIGDHLGPDTIGLEIFIHGALCYSYSGQCLLSSAIGGRSGNRGRCAQPCRKPYILVQGMRDAYDRIPHPQVLSTPTYCLSTRDLSTYLHLDEILRLPVTALKIEGRMKSPEYVGTVVRIYRRAMDAIAAGDWGPRSEDITDLMLAFNRGFTGGPLFGEPVMGSSRPDHQGLLVGTVAGYQESSRALKIRLEEDTLPERGDGLLLATDGEGQGIRVIRTPHRAGSFLYVYSPGPVLPGTRVFLTHRASLGRIVEQAMQRPIYRPLPVSVQVTWRDRRATFEGTLQRKQETLPFRYESSLLWEEARTQPLSAQQIIQQLEKSGGTPFALKVDGLRYPGGLFLSLGALNTLRRDLLEYLGSLLRERHRPPATSVQEAERRIASYHPPVRSHVPTGEPECTVWVHTLDGVQAALDGGADSVCLESDTERMSSAADLCREQGVPLIWIWPRIIPEAQLSGWLSSLSHREGRNLAGVMVSAPGIAQAVRAQYPHLPIRGSVDLNVWNHCTVRTLGPLFSSLLLSPELSLAQIHALTRRLPPDSPRLGCLVQGNLEVMVSEHCPDERIGKPGQGAWGLLDIRDRLFPLILNGEGRTHIYNAVETCYIDQLPALREAGIASFAIEGRYRSPGYVREMTSLYREALNRERGGDPNVADLKEEIRKRARGGITLGPLIRGLKEES